MNEFVEKKRPVIITIVCVFVAMGLIFSVGIMPFIFENTGEGIAFSLVVDAILGLIYVVGLWEMKKYGAFAFLILVIFNQASSIYMGVWHFTSLISPILIGPIIIAHYDKLD